MLERNQWIQNAFKNASSYYNKFLLALLIVTDELKCDILPQSTTGDDAKETQSKEQRIRDCLTSQHSLYELESACCRYVINILSEKPTKFSLKKRLKDIERHPPFHLYPSESKFFFEYFEALLGADMNDWLTTKCRDDSIRKAHITVPRTDKPLSAQVLEAETKVKHQFQQKIRSSQQKYFREYCVKYLGSQKELNCKLNCRETKEGFLFFSFRLVGNS